MTAGVRVALDVLSEPGPMVLPTPAYHPQFGLGRCTDREVWELPLDPGRRRTAELDLDRLDACSPRGARTLLLTQPHNPLGHVYTRAELEGIRDVALRHGARVISDEIHAPLVLPGAEHVPTSPSTAPPTTRSRSSPPARRSTPPGCAAPRSSPPTRPPATGCSPSRWPATTRGRRSAWSPRSRRTSRATRGWPRSSSGSTRSARCSASCSPSTCPRPGCARWRRPSWPGSTCARTATTTRRRSRSTRGGSSSRRGTATSRTSPATSGSTSRPRPSGSPRSCSRLGLPPLGVAQPACWGWAATRSAYQRNDFFGVRTWVSWSTCTRPKRCRKPSAHSKLSISDQT